MADGHAGSSSPGHGERLSSVDASLLEMERPEVHMHVGGLLVFDPPTPHATVGPASGFARFLALMRSRLHLVPRYRQRLLDAPLGLGNPVWVDDPDFDLSYHVRHAALPAPGTIQQLTEYSARILSRPLDRDRPLWELYVIEGLEEGRFAILTKSHQALVDGLVGLDITSVMLDDTPDATDQLPDPASWAPAPAPSPAELTRRAVVELSSSPVEAYRTGRKLAAAPARSLLRAAQVGLGVASVARSNLSSRAPRSLLNQPPGPHRRLAVQRLELDGVKAIKDTFGTTVNDVILAVVADATGRYLRSRGVRTDGLWHRVMVPVATRSAATRHPLGNRVVSVLVDVPMFEMDPVERLRRCSDAMGDAVSSHQAVGARFLTELGQFAPPTIHAMASRVAARGRLYNFLVANVPGPQAPVYCLGARLLGSFPFTPLAPTQSYAVGVTSIEGWLNVGLIADYDAIPDLDRIPPALVDAVAELRRSAEAAGTRGELVRRDRQRRGGDAAST